MREFTQDTAMRLINKMRVIHGKKFTDQYAGIEVHEIVEAMIECLSGLTTEQFARGFERLKTSPTCPSIADFRAWCSPNADWLTPDEAWAQVQCAADDRNTVVWTEQAQQAWAACQPLIEIGDKFSAARCFKDAYKRAVEASSLRGIKPIYQVSLGYDLEQRSLVIREAESKGLLECKQVEQAIGYIETGKRVVSGIAEKASQALLALSMSPEQAKAHLASLLPPDQVNEFLHLSTLDPKQVRAHWKKREVDNVA